MSIAEKRLAEERKSWRKDHPYGFSAKPESKPDGSTNLLTWVCKIPGKEGTDWQRGLYTVTLTFSLDYPAVAPICKFTPYIFHCNVFKSGQICLDIINAAWKPSISIKQLLLSIQTLLDEPNPKHVTDAPESTNLYNKDINAYRRRIREQALRFVSDSD